MSNLPHNMSIGQKRQHPVNETIGPAKYTPKFESTQPSKHAYSFTKTKSRPESSKKSNIGPGSYTISETSVSPKKQKQQSNMPRQQQLNMKQSLNYLNALVSE